LLCAFEIEIKSKKLDIDLENFGAIPQELN
jgi:hypothetical protein